MREVDVSGRKIGPGHPCFIIAEAGVNHNGDLDLARRLVEVAAEAKADAVKFQTFRAERMVTANSPKADYQIRTTGALESSQTMLKDLELSPAAHREIQAHSREHGVLFFSTPYDRKSSDVLDKLSVPLFKIGSGDITNVPLLEHVARKGKPMILSTGMSHLREVEDALAVIQEAGDPQVLLLHCVSDYPAEPADANLKAIQTLERAFQVPVGFSDHTLGTAVSLAAVAMGAHAIEKHVTLDKTLPGPDHQASLEPPELKEFVNLVRTVERSLGDGRKRPMPSESENRWIARRSVVARVDVPAGTVLRSSMLTTKRPGTGIPPTQLKNLIGKTARADIQEDTLISWDQVQ